MVPSRKVPHLRMVDEADQERRPAAPPLTPAERRQRDREWIARLREGDELVFVEIFTAYYAPLGRYAATLVHSRDAALDIVSDVFQALWLKRAYLEPIGLWPYLLTATRNRALDALDHRRIEEVTASRLAAAGVSPEMGSTGRQTPDDELVSREEAGATAARAAQIEHAYAELPPRSRHVFELWAKGLSYKEISCTLGIALKTVDSHLQQAKRTLRRLLSSC